MSTIIRLQNLPLSAKSTDVRHFFGGLHIPSGGVHILGGEKGEAFIAFNSDEDARLAMRKDGWKIKGTCVYLYRSSYMEMQYEVDRKTKAGGNIFPLSPRQFVERRYSKNERPEWHKDMQVPSSSYQSKNRYRSRSRSPRKKSISPNPFSPRKRLRNPRSPSFPRGHYEFDERVNSPFQSNINETSPSPRKKSISLNPFLPRQRSRILRSPSYPRGHYEADERVNSPFQSNINEVSRSPRKKSISPNPFLPRKSSRSLRSPSFPRGHYEFDERVNSPFQSNINETSRSPRKKSISPNPFLPRKRSRSLRSSSCSRGHYEVDERVNSPFQSNINENHKLSSSELEARLERRIIEILENSSMSAKNEVQNSLSFTSNSITPYQQNYLPSPSSLISYPAQKVPNTPVQNIQCSPISPLYGSDVAQFSSLGIPSPFPINPTDLLQNSSSDMNEMSNPPNCMPGTEIPSPVSTHPMGFSSVQAEIPPTKDCFYVAVSGLDPIWNDKEIKAMFSFIFIPTKCIKWEVDNSNRRIGTAFIKLINREDFEKVIASPTIFFSNKRITVSECPDFVSCNYFQDIPDFKSELCSNETEDLTYKLKGLPSICDIETIANFFHGLEVTDTVILFNKNHDTNGNGYVSFRNARDFEEAFCRNGEKIGCRYIQMIKCTDKEMARAKLQKNALLSFTTYSKLLKERNLSKDRQPLCVLMTRLPLKTSMGDLKSFLDESGIKPEAIHITISRIKMCDGRAFIEFTNFCDFELALKLNGTSFMDSRICLKQILYDEMVKILDTQKAKHHFEVHADIKLKLNEPEKLPHVLEPQDASDANNKLPTISDIHVVTDYNMSMHAGKNRNLHSAGLPISSNLKQIPNLKQIDTSNSQVASKTPKNFSDIIAELCLDKKRNLTYRLIGLPSTCIVETIAKFFQGLKVIDTVIYYNENNEATGGGYVSFGNIRDFEEAFCHNGEKIGDNCIEMVKDTDANMAQAKLTYPNCKSFTTYSKLLKERNLPRNRQQPMCIILTGLQEITSVEELQLFFFRGSGIAPDAIHITINWEKKCDGRAFAEFEKFYSFERALRLDGTSLCGNIISLKHILYKNMVKILDTQKARHYFDMAFSVGLKANKAENLPYVSKSPDLLENSNTFHTESDILVDDHKTCDSQERKVYFPRKNISLNLKNQSNS